MASGALSALRRLVTVIAIAIVFVFGLGTTVYLSLRSPEVRVPEVLGKNRIEAEKILEDAGLNFRVRAFRPSSELQADTVLFQLPRAGEVVKAGQTVAMDLSRAVKEGESSEVAAPEKTPEEKTDEKANRNANEAGNENKPKRKTTNKNENANSNGNSNSTGNRNANANRSTSNLNVNRGNANTTTNASSNRPAVNTNSSRGANQNDNRRPAVPKPTPVRTPNR